MTQNELFFSFFIKISLTERLLVLSYFVSFFLIRICWLDLLLYYFFYYFFLFIYLFWFVCVCVYSLIYENDFF